MASDVMRVRLHLRQIRVLAVAVDTPSELVVEVLIASYLLQESPSEEQLAGYDPLTKWEFMVPTVPKESFLPRIIKKAGPEPEA